MLKGMVKAISGFGGDVQNVLTQHTPVLKRIVSHLCNGTLPEEQFPFQAVSHSSVQPDPAARCADIMVFIAGGATYEESMLVSKINRGVVENDPTTFPPGAEVAQPGGAAAAPGASPQHVRGQPSQDAQSGGKGMFSDLAHRFTGHATDDGDATEAAAAAGKPAAVAKHLGCHVRLVSNGMLRSGEFMLGLP
jgi:hypothetical protein